MMKNVIKGILQILAFFAVGIGGGWLLSKAEWIAGIRRPYGWMAWLGIGACVCGGIRLMIKAECRRTPMIERWIKVLEIVFWVMLTALLLFRSAMKFSGAI